MCLPFIFYSYSFLLLFKTTILNLSILHNFTDMLFIYFAEFYTCTSLNLMSYMIKKLDLKPTCKDNLLQDIAQGMMMVS